MAYGNLAVLDGGSVSRNMGADIIATVYHLRQKMQWGPQGTVNEVDVATPLPIQGPAAENAAVAGNPLLAGGRYDAADRTLTDGDAGALAVTLKGILKTALTDSTGAQVDPVTVAEDSAHGSGDSGIPAWAVRRDAKAVGSGTDGDYSTLNVNPGGDLRVDGGDSHMTGLITPVVSASAYADGDCVGADTEVANMARISGGGGTLMAISLLGASAVAASEFGVYVFDREPSAGTYTDNGALTINATDRDYLVGYFELDTADPEGVMVFKENINKPYVCNATSLWVLIRSIGYVGTPGGTSEFDLKLHTIRD